MGGTNPYIKKPDAPAPTKPYKITFLGLNKTILVDPSRSTGETGLPHSILEIALSNGIDIDHACGGVSACSTCHVWIKEGATNCSLAEDSENDMLDLAPDVKPSSRLACQCVPNGNSDISVEIPSWNRNLVREGK